MLASACGGRHAAELSPLPGVATSPRITLLQLNDVYEITALGGGRWGGPARVATLLRQLESENPHTWAVLAGDLLSPSALGTAVVDDERLEGRQMVAVLNAMGLDYATFGNHEFDLRDGPFHARLRESRFEWTSANVRASGGAPLPGVTPYAILRTGSDAAQLRVALIGVTMDRDAPAYASISDPIEAARAMAALLEDSADVLIAVTHQTLARDVELAESVPAIDLIAGGHDHENLHIRRGEDLTPITKADANARSVWIHDITRDGRTGEPRVDSRLSAITPVLAEEAATAAEARRWVDAAYAGFRRSGFEPDEIVGTTPVDLDGLESSVRNRVTALTELIAAAMYAEVPAADGAIVNGGSIRVDDVLRPGPLTQYDIIRILPFGGPVVEVEMRGSLLARVLDQGLRNRGGGGFLHHAAIERSESGWRIGSEGLDPARMYRIATTDFLLTGREQGLDFLTRTAQGLRVLEDRRDVRLALIDEIRRRWPPGTARD